ncbi:MAG: hypothetical protein KAS04_01445, partial [Candidatus Aenigmarchaeota archaeon]|nr:hypothetical protein [Candidatus Aenigmarchaeota archaeon]
QDIIFIPGVELTTQNGHLLALGITEHVESFKSFEESIDLIRDAGGIAISSHPYDMRGEGARKLALKTDAIEIFNSMNIDRVGNRVMLSKFKNHDIPKVVGSDAHSPDIIGRCLNIMNDVHDVDSVLKAILNGKVQFTTDYIHMDEMIAWTRKRIEHSKTEVLNYINNHYSAPRAWLYRKLLKKFLATSDKPWIVLGDISLCVICSYAFAKTLTY